MLQPRSVLLGTDRGKHLIHGVQQIREWCLVVSHIHVRVHEDQRMVISHSWKQVSSSAIFGKVGWRQCHPVLRCQYYDEHKASITMADVVAITQLQWDVHNASLAILYNDVTQTRVTHWSRYHSDVNHSLSLPNIRIAIQAKIFISTRENSLGTLGLCYRCARIMLHIHTKGKVSKRRRKET